MGRLIRSAENSGVVARFDHRFLARTYRDQLPADWLPEEADPTSLAAGPDAAAREFFERLR
jgi:Rad3-related DNA helicase